MVLPQSYAKPNEAVLEIGVEPVTARHAKAASAAADPCTAMQPVVSQGQVFLCGLRVVRSPKPQCLKPGSKSLLQAENNTEPKVTVPDVGTKPVPELYVKEVVAIVGP